MKRFLHLMAAATLLFAGTAWAQEEPVDSITTPAPFLKPPIFLLMPGGLTTNAISVPEGVPSHTAFNARFQTVIPTSTPWLSFVGGVQWGLADEDDHGPIIFYGPLLNVVPVNTATRGWFTLLIDPLGVSTGPGGDGTNFVLEGAVLLNIGAMMMRDTPFAGFFAYFLVDQQLTRLPEDINGDKDYFTPALLYGVGIPIAPWGQ